MPPNHEAIAVFNLRPRVEIQRFGSGQVCVVVDDALADPEKLLQFAVAQREQFRTSDANAYPGVMLALSDKFTASLGDFFAAHARRHFDARRTVHVHSRLSMVTLPPSELRPWQCICHRDPPAVDRSHSIQGSVLYLFRDGSLGGTSFYEPSRSAAETSQLFEDANRLPDDLFWRKYDIDRGYLCGSNSWFNRVGEVPARWNRIIFYDAYGLHSGDIGAPDRLTADPLTGRLTLNGFFTSRRNVS
jgi:hypothetical protein